MNKQQMIKKTLNRITGGEAASYICLTASSNHTKVMLTGEGADAELAFLLWQFFKEAPEVKKLLKLVYEAEGENDE